MRIALSYNLSPKKTPLIILSLTYRLNHPSMNRLHDAVNDSPEVVFLS